jgi:hypothetical protein
MIGKVLAIVFGVVVVGAVVVGFLAVVPSPSTCTPDVAAGSAADARAQWDAWAAAAPPSDVTFTEADATAILRERSPDLAIKDPVVHFCGDGTAQLSFSYPIGPVTVKAVATGTVGSTSPLSVEITSIAIGGLPSAITEPVVGAVKDVAAKAASLGLEGPINAVSVSQGQVTVSQ